MVMRRMHGILQRGLCGVVTASLLLSGCGPGGGSAFETWRSETRTELIDNLIVGGTSLSLYDLDTTGESGLPYVGFQTAATLALLGDSKAAQAVIDRWDASGWNDPADEAIIPANFVAYEYVRAHQALGTFDDNEQQAARASIEAHLDRESTASTDPALINVVDHYVNRFVVDALPSNPALDRSLQNWVRSRPLSCGEQEIADGSDGLIAEMVYLGVDDECDTAIVRERFQTLFANIDSMAGAGGWSADTCSALESLALVATSSDDYELSVVELRQAVERAIETYRLDTSADPDLCTAVLPQALATLGGFAQFDPTVTALLRDVGQSGTYPAFAAISDDEVGALSSLLELGEADLAVLIERYGDAGRPVPAILLGHDADRSAVLDFAEYPISTYLTVSRDPEMYCESEVLDLDGSANPSPLMSQLVQSQLIAVAKACGGGLTSDVDEFVDQSLRRLAEGSSFVSSSQWIDIVTVCSLSDSPEDRRAARESASSIVERSGSNLESVSILDNGIETAILLADIARLSEESCP